MREQKNSHAKMIFQGPGRRRRRIPTALLVIAALVALFALIRPSSFMTEVNPSSVKIPTATGPATPKPAPTDEHGGHIVFTCTREDMNQICMIAPDGSGFQQLTENTTNSYYPAVAPSGREVVFAVNQYDGFDLFRIALDAAGGARQARSQTKRLTDNVGNAFSPKFSPDGRQVAFLNRVDDAPGEIWLMGTEGEDPHPVYSSGGGAIVALAWAPDGTRFAFSMSTAVSFAYEVFVLDANESNAAPEQVSRGIRDIGGSLSWSPDARKLLIFAGPAAAREIYELELSNGAITQLTYGGNNASPAYSPDGQYIVFNSLRNAGQADLFIMMADGHSMRQLTDFPEPDWQPQWGP